MATNPCCVWDFTIKVEDESDHGGGSPPNPPWWEEGVWEIRECLEEHCKEWVFQLERGVKTGYLHYQGRLKLKMKSRLPKIGLPKLTHFSVTSSENRDNMFYVMKDDTRVDGPWGTSIVKKPWDIVDELRPWQMDVVASFKVRERRKINVIYDEDGNIGKSTLAKYCGWNKIAKEIPLVNDYKDLMQMVMDMPKLGGYIVDMPRAMKKEKLYQVWSALEKVKGGYAFDLRYRFRDQYFDPPVIWVFTNSMPDRNLLTGDRWKFFRVMNNELKDFSGAAL